MRKTLFRGALTLALILGAGFAVQAAAPEPTRVEAEPLPIELKKPVVMQERKRIAFAIEEKKEPTYAYTTTDLKVRSMPDVDSDWADTLRPNVKVECVECDVEGWTGIKINDIVYYVCSDFLTEEEPEEIITLESLMPARYSDEDSELIFKDKFENWTLTAYCACEKCCGKWSKYKKTASGTTPEEGRTVACVSLAFGTIININGEDYIVEDTGHLSDTQIDIYFESHQEALIFGRQKGTVYLIEGGFKN